MKKKVLYFVVALVVVLSLVFVFTDFGVGGHGSGHNMDYHEKSNLEGNRKVDKVMGGEVITVNVKGMFCNACAKSLEKKFSKMYSVHDVAVSFENQTVIIAMKKGKTLSDKVLSKNIADAGFTFVNSSRRK